MPKLSLEFIVPALVELLEDEVYFSDQIHEAVVASMPKDGVLLLENTRFFPEETGGGDKELGSGAWRKNTQPSAMYLSKTLFQFRTVITLAAAGIAEFLPAYAGLNMERELDHLSQALDVPKKPVMAVVGGAKVSTKIELLSNLVEKLDVLAIGGGMANTFLFALGHKVGKSLHEPDFKDTALAIMKAAKKANCRILLPVDGIAAKEFKAPMRPTGLSALIT